MDMQTTNTLTLKLTPEMAKRLEEMAQAQQRSLIEVAQETFESAVLSDDEDDEEWEEDSNEDILAGLRESLEDMKAGRMRDAREVIEEIRQAQKLKNHDAS